MRLDLNRPAANHALTLVEALAMAGILILVVLAVVPAARTALQKRGERRVVGNGRALWEALQSFNRERAATNLPPVWPGTNYSSSTRFFVDCSSTNVLGSRFAHAMLAAPGIPAYTGAVLTELTASNNAWCVTLNVTTSTPPDAPFLFTANFSSRDDKRTLYHVDGLDPRARPFGDRVGVVVTVDGRTRVFRKADLGDDFNSIFNPSQATNRFVRP